MVTDESHNPPFIAAVAQITFSATVYRYRFIACYIPPKFQQYFTATITANINQECQYRPSYRHYFDGL
jgi:hypothetical protein